MTGPTRIPAHVVTLGSSRSSISTGKILCLRISFLLSRLTPSINFIKASSRPQVAHKSTLQAISQAHSLLQLRARTRSHLTWSCHRPFPLGRCLTGPHRVFHTATARFPVLHVYPTHTKGTLKLLDDTLRRFHAKTSVFLDLGIREHFKLPKLHFLDHYRQSIEMFGTMDNYDT